jgi:hypothetical protein
MIAFITKDRKTIDRITVNIDNARVKVGNSVIVVDKSRIYREDKPQAGFVMNKSHIKWDEGVPTLYVYADSLKPADFFDEPSKVSAEDVGTVLISFVRIEIMKGLEAIKKYEMFFFIIIGLVILVGVGLYVVYGEVQTTHAVANACVANTQLIMDRFGITANQTLNNTLMVK